MSPRRLCLILILGIIAPLSAQTPAEPIDFNRARQLIDRQRAGGSLSPEEQAYLNRARAEREKQPRAPAPGSPGAAARPASQRPAPARIIPVTDLGTENRYAGQDGGLYGAGRNTPPDELRQTAAAVLAQITPLAADGRPAVDGLIGFVALSMSNATQEFARFKQVADAAPRKSPRVVIVDCAQGGQAMAEWAAVDARPWEVARQRLAAARVSELQVQVAWIKLANKGPTGSLEEHGRKLERDTLALLQHARTHFPNLRVAYLGSRTYGGYAVGGLNPEPYAFESAFPARWLILRQLQHDPELALARVPLLLWGPYLWADGIQGRKLDSLIWERSDFGPDGVHPSERGRDKVAALLLDFFTTDPLARSWFTGPTARP
jgi:hypothetical protein